MNFPDVSSAGYRFRLVIAFVCMWCCSATFAQDAPAPALTLRVLSYNIHHGRGTDNQVDLARIAKVISDSQADLVALQEVDHGTRRTGGVDQTSELGRLTGMHSQFCKQIDYDDGEYGQALLSR